MKAFRLMHLFAAALLLISTAVTADDERARYIVDQNGCRIVNPSPRPEETVTWSGGCKEGLAEGKGVLQFFQSGIADEKYEGAMRDGYAEGDGVQTMVDGGRYEGQFSRSRQHGEGTFYAPDGSIFKGEWKNGKPHGNGTFRTPEGRVTRGTWVDGVFQSEEPADPNRT